MQSILEISSHSLTLFSNKLMISIYLKSVWPRKLIWHGFMLFSYIFMAGLVGCSSSKQDIRLSRYQGSPKRVAIVGFDVNAKTYGVKEIDKKLIDMLSTALFRTGNFVMVERSKINKVLEEQAFQLSGAVDPKTAVEIGKILGAEAVVTGAVSEIGFQALSFLVNMTACRVSVDIRIIDVSTAKVVMAENGEGRSLYGGIIFVEDAADAIKRKDLEIWISEAVRNAAENVAKKINVRMAIW